MLRKAINIIFFISFFTNALSAIPILELKDYAGYDFTHKKLALIKKGDNPDYKNPGIDDSDWDTISLPSCWNTLYPEWSDICWYRIHIEFPSQVPTKSMGIKLGVIEDVDEVFFNGHLIGKTGEFPPARRSAYDKKRIYEIPTRLIKPGKDNVMAIRVAGLFQGENGAFKGRFKIAPFQELQRDLLTKEFIDVLFVIIYLVVGLYFSLIFIRGTTNKEHLFFSLFTISAAVYLFLRTQIKYLITDDFFLLKRFEYLIVIAILFFMMEYITYFYKRRHALVNYVYYCIVGVSMTLIIFSGDINLWHKILFYIIQPTWIIPLAFCFYISFKELKNDIDARYILATFVIMGTIFINDVLIDRRVYDFISLSTYGFLIIIIGTAIIMRNRFMRLSEELETFRAKKNRKPAISSDTKKKFHDAIAYLEENYMHDISRENFAESIGLNHDYLGKLFIQYKGMKMSDYIKELRINKAKELLIDSDQNVTQIAFAVGFDSLSTFYRVFQKVMNESPTSYRDRNRKNG